MKPFISISVLAVLLMPVISFAEDMGEEMENIFSLFAEEVPAMGLVHSHRATRRGSGLKD